MSRREINKTVQERKQCQSQLQQTLSAPQRTSDQDLELFAQKAKILDTIVESKMYFTPRISFLSDTKKEITISMVGGKAMNADAGDLVLNYSNNLKIIQILPGQAFPLYPRKVVTNGELAITGIASLENNKIKFGEPNKIFAILRVEKIGDIKQKGILSVKKTNTNVFLEGKSIFDPNKTFNQIEL